MKALRTTILCSLGFALIFSLLSLVFYFGNWTRLIVVAFMGLFFGMVAAPEFEPSVFKNPGVLQTVSGLAFGLVVGFGFNLALEQIIAALIIGGFVGWSAPFWVKHVPFP